MRCSELKPIDEEMVWNTPAMAIMVVSNMYIIYTANEEMTEALQSYDNDQIQKHIKVLLH